MSEIDIATSLLDEYSDAKIQELIDLRPWMKDKTFRLLHEHAEIEQYIDQCIEKNICALDLETTSLNTRRDADGNSVARIVGICMALDPDEGVYIPVGHRDKDYNVSERFIISQLKRLTSNCVCVYHNFKYDGQVLYNYGIVIEDYRMIEDTMVMSAIEDAGRKTKGLKPLSEHLLKRPMIEIADLGIQGLRKAVVAFDMVPPQNALYYGAPDAMNTLLLYQYFKQKIDEQDPTGKAGPWIVYGIEKRCIFVTMEMERNLAKIDRGYFQELRNRVQKNIENTKEAVFEMIGHEFDLNSPKQVGPILFEEQKIPYPEKQKTASGQYETSEAVLEKLDKYPVVALILKYRKLTKVQGTYIDNFLKNADENDEVKFQLNQVRADTGRYTATGGKGLEVDGYCGVNCQNIPKPDEKDPEVIDLRKGIIARPGYKILSIDYSGEELRIAANFSREPKWIKEFKEGTGDIHSITARIIYGREEISKKERAIGKRLNFLTLYKGGAGGFSTAAKIPYETARRMLINFFRDYKGLKNWMDREIRICRKRGYSKTVFGRRRPLQKFYATSDKQIQAKGDRCAINSSIQGCLQPHERCLTTQGYLPIKEIQKRKNQGEKLKVWTGGSWADFDVLNRGEAQFAKIELENGLSLDCDTRHEVLTVGNNGYVFKKFEDIDEDTLVCTSVPEIREFGRYPDKTEFSGGKAHNARNLIIKDQKDYDFIAYLIGTVLGDGYVRNDAKREKYTVSIGFGKEKLDKNFEKLSRGLERIGLKFSMVNRTIGSLGLSYQGHIHSRALVSLLEYYGYNFETARKKRVPHRIFECPLSMRLSFLKGYFDTDGSKSAKTRYNFHTPNLDLLKDVQLLAWTLGLASVTKTLNGGTHRLEWSDLSAFEKVMGLPVSKRKKAGGKMLLPRFLYRTAYHRIKEDGRYVYSSQDRALLCNLNRERRILVRTVLKLLKKYECKISDIYYHYRIKKKTILESKGDTYTLCVHSDLHRFDSSAIISKNTGADIIKVALYKVWKWIRDNDLQDDVKILMPIHDEIVFEIKEDKLEVLTPEICKVMTLGPTIESLGWEIPLEVDAEYGDSFHVDHDFWEDFSASPEKEKVDENLPETKSVEQRQENNGHEGGPEVNNGNGKESLEPVSKETENNDSGGTDRIYDTTYNEGPQVYCTVTVNDGIKMKLTPEEQAKAALQKSDNGGSECLVENIKTKEHLDKEGYFNYALEMDQATARRLRFIFETLTSVGKETFVGPKYKMCLLNRNGEVIYKTSEKYPVDAFLALCLSFNV